MLVIICRSANRRKWMVVSSTQKDGCETMENHLLVIWHLDSRDIILV